MTLNGDRLQTDQSRLGGAFAAGSQGRRHSRRQFRREDRQRHPEFVSEYHGKMSPLSTPDLHRCGSMSVVIPVSMGYRPRGMNQLVRRASAKNKETPPRERTGIWASLVSQWILENMRLQRMALTQASIPSPRVSPRDQTTRETRPMM